MAGLSSSKTQTAPKRRKTKTNMEQTERSFEQLAQAWTVYLRQKAVDTAKNTAAASTLWSKKIGSCLSRSIVPRKDRKEEDAAGQERKKPTEESKSQSKRLFENVSWSGGQRITTHDIQHVLNENERTTFLSLRDREECQNFLFHLKFSTPTTDFQDTRARALALTGEQKRAFDLARIGRNLFLTGGAGRGKSYLIRLIVEHLLHEGMTVAVCAPTGIASENLGAVTMHSLFGLQEEESTAMGTMTSQFAAGSRAKLAAATKAKDQRNAAIRRRIARLQVLVLDEISMVDAATLDRMHDIACAARQCDLPFGGLQLILSGDPFQLPPPKRGTATPKRTVTATNNNNTVRFFFDSVVWKRLNQRFRTSTFANGSVLSEDHSRLLEPIELVDNFRQSQSEFSALLNRARFGQLQKSDLDLLRTSLVDRHNGFNRAFLTPTDMVSLFCVRLYPARKMVDEHNARMEAILERFATEQGKRNFCPILERHKWSSYELNEIERKKKTFAQKKRKTSTGPMSVYDRILYLRDIVPLTRTYCDAMTWLLQSLNRESRGKQKTGRCGQKEKERESITGRRHRDSNRSDFESRGCLPVDHNNKDDSRELKRNLVEQFSQPLTVGSRVMLTKNWRVAEGLVHGKAGWVTKLPPPTLQTHDDEDEDEDEGKDEGKDEDYHCEMMDTQDGAPKRNSRTKGDGPWVLFDGQKEPIQVPLFPTKVVFDKGYLIFWRLYLKPCWAMTIHKSQGLSLDRAELFLSQVFSSGQAYVALSRLKSLDGLRVLQLDPAAFQVETRVLEFYSELFPNSPELPSTHRAAPTTLNENESTAGGPDDSLLEDFFATAGTDQSNAVDDEDDDARWAKNIRQEKRGTESKERTKAIKEKEEQKEQEEKKTKEEKEQDNSERNGVLVAKETEEKDDVCNASEKTASEKNGSADAPMMIPNPAFRDATLAPGANEEAILNQFGKKWVAFWLLQGENTAVQSSFLQSLKSRVEKEMEALRKRRDKILARATKKRDE